MTGRAVLAPQAEAEFREILVRIHAEQPAAARRLRQDVDRATRRLGAHPHLGRAEPKLARPHFRFWSIRAFSLLLVYNASTNPVRIVRIVHTARDLDKLLRDLRL